MAQDVADSEACHHASVDDQHLVGVLVRGEPLEPSVHEHVALIVGGPIGDPKRAQVLENHNAGQGRAHDGKHHWSDCHQV
eukprot:CAMPEP_0206517670 /NCGR_PEP_ID=MMETSP0324_2-20121206/64120_1 /ASSEMBLY_ACC=CAM_ASM_000836 /TAXON_ID=2866 /ORGANISM="Crypthecodinium cohnii, Strain Seligo" /LENGTH=79 /DNA_ID=CAMNT_0054010877 /DNA_START=181 /DNA_END=416 /DNA_ORIENTATION=+